MSDNEELEVEVAAVEEEEEPDFGIPRVEVTPEIIAKGLSEIRKTAGEFTTNHLNFFLRRSILRIY